MSGISYRRTKLKLLPDAVVSDCSHSDGSPDWARKPTALTLSPSDTVSAGTFGSTGAKLAAKQGVTQSLILQHDQPFSAPDGVRGYSGDQAVMRIDRSIQLDI